MINEFGYFCLSSVLFAVGLFGVLANKKSIITILISTEIILLAANINFVIMSAVHGVEGYIFAIMILTIAAAELSVGLAILIVHFKNANNINVADLNKLKG